MRVRLSIQAPGSTEVSVSGDFTNWEPRAMRRVSPRARTFATTLNLAPGEYQYKFIVDGEWMLDPGAPTAPNCFGTGNSLLVVPAEQTDTPARLRAARTARKT